ncbi:MAG: HupE/UreJ family protein [Paracoccaceae bacterium]|nr:HupE/UreJ family protein [Paracoccaceae bacterium]
MKTIDNSHAIRLSLAGLALTIVSLVAASLVVAPARAHEIRPAIASATIEESGALEVQVALNLEAYLAEIGPEHGDTDQSPQAAEYDALRALTPRALESRFAPLAEAFAAGFQVAFDGAPAALAVSDITVLPAGDTDLARISTLRLTGAVPDGAARMRFAAPERLGDTVLRITKAGEGAPFFASYQSPGQAADAIALRGGQGAGAWEALANYTAIGFEHIVPKGLDHILFVVGLFLLSPHLRPLLWQITGFTLAHSVTLALGIYGVVRISPSIVEPLIAASIVFVAVENLFTDRLQRWRPFVVFGFGLLHGLGFAGVLAEFGLPTSQFLPALVGFNIGVELGQLSVIGACFLAVGLWFRHRHWYRRAITMPASALVALVATVWFFERIA